MMEEVSTLTAAEAAQTRRSIRRFTDDPVPDEDLREILRLAGLAPSAFNLQPWRWVVVRDAETKERLRDAANGQRQVTAAPAVIVLYSDMRDVLDDLDATIHPGVQGEARERTAANLRRTFGAMSEQEREGWGASQSFIALGYLLLIARSMGYDSSAMGGFDPAKVKAVLGLPAHVRVNALVAIGVGDEQGYPHHRHDVERIAAFR
ncbi:MAG TPA: nitroreductase family protein [Gemmatimonadaceae bacterium]|nr:nitroreductase family protein [Gemmatimonadaceae bacterium]